MAGAPGATAAVAHSCDRHLIVLPALKASDVTGSAVGATGERLSVSCLGRNQVVIRSICGCP